jgi:hypothetical protein
VLRKIEDNQSLRKLRRLYSFHLIFYAMLSIHFWADNFSYYRPSLRTIQDIQRSVRSDIIESYIYEDMDEEGEGRRKARVVR